MPPHLTYFLRVCLTLLAAWLAAELCVALHTPLPWMIGPLLVTALLSMMGAATRSATACRNAGQWTIATALGLYFTPEVARLVSGLWWAIALAIVWALLLGWGFGAWLYRMTAPRMPLLAARPARATCYFAGAIGGASEMTLLAEREGARTDLVAAAHSLRLLIVTITIPFALQWSGLQGIDHLPPATRVVDATGLIILMTATGAGALVMRRLGRANPWFLGALLVTLLITVTGHTLSAIPQIMVNAAQLFIGVSLGVRFSREFLRTAPRWMGMVAVGTFALMALCALFAVGLSWLTGQHWVTLVLSTSPGGIAEMAITAKVLQLGVPVVTAFQVCRLIAVLLLVAPLYRRLYGPRAAEAQEKTPLAR
ncbi:AbrB family transcriptional regulator [Diaphorobacter aerolatus]|uniref:AbrB family transcriptional regulator n=1 Tax=Diaphorobacter aerolatus TaxID=1288495 RepID=A0A7H0GP72_9BURK|nr:AbrB family transcriptional regulator [Diaphorobacter aerolatus]QNP50088.1 AbrB family transcriptional regulator [Diaphorobacter aerolatus]